MNCGAYGGDSPGLNCGDPGAYGGDSPGLNCGDPGAYGGDSPGLYCGDSGVYSKSLLTDISTNCWDLGLIF